MIGVLFSFCLPSSTSIDASELYLKNYVSLYYNITEELWFYRKLFLNVRASSGHLVPELGFMIPFLHTNLSYLIQHAIISILRRRSFRPISLFL